MTNTPVSAERLQEMLAGLDGVTPGPWHIIPDASAVTTLAESWEATVADCEHGDGSKPWEQVTADAAHIARCDPDTIRSIVTELLALRSPSLEPRAVEPLRVKPLVWVDYRGDGTMQAKPPYGEALWATPTGWGNRHYPNQFKGDGLEANMAAAEAHYHALILSTIEPSAIEPVGVSEALIEALKPFAAVADEYDDSEDDSCEVWIDVYDPKKLIRGSFALAHYRRARNALSSLPAPRAVEVGAYPTAHPMAREYLTAHACRDFIADPCGSSKCAGCGKRRSEHRTAHESTPEAEPVAATVSAQTWIELREPGCVPERKGPLPPSMVTDFLREVFQHRPSAYVTVITVNEDGVPLLQDGPECLQMLDGRSMSTGRKHMVSSAQAHADHRPAPPETTAVKVDDDMVERAARHRAGEIYDAVETHRELRPYFIDRTWRQHSIIVRSILYAALSTKGEGK